MFNLAPLTTAEVAAQLGVSRMTVTRMIRDGRLGTVRTDPYLFDRSEVERVATERKSA